MKKDRTNKLEVQLRETFDYMDNKRSKSEQRYSPADQFSFRTSLRSADRLSLVSEGRHFNYSSTISEWHKRTIAEFRNASVVVDFDLCKIAFPHNTGETLNINSSCRTVALRNFFVVERPESYSATHSKNCIFIAQKKVAHGLDLISPYFYFVR